MTTENRPPKTDHRKPKTSIIVAMADNNVIGNDNKMPWHLPEDLRRFKNLTMGKPCIMGRKTYESILDQLGKPLPGRTSLVVSGSGYEHAGAESFRDLDSALQRARDIAAKDGLGEIMIIGGAQIYALALPLVNRLYITKVRQTPDGDALFPQINEKDWDTVSQEDHEGYSFTTLGRVKDEKAD